MQLFEAISGPPPLVGSVRGSLKRWRLNALAGAREPRSRSRTMTARNLDAGVLAIEPPRINSDAARQKTPGWAINAAAKTFEKTNSCNGKRSRFNRTPSRHSSLHVQGPSDAPIEVGIQKRSRAFGASLVPRVSGVCPRGRVGARARVARGRNLPYYEQRGRLIDPKSLMLGSAAGLLAMGRSAGG
jgi:hypothetical protein